MKITRKILSYAGPLWLITLSQVVVAQTAPKPSESAPAPKAVPVNAPTTKAAATPASAPATPTVDAPADPPTTTNTAAAAAPAPVATVDADAAVLPPPAPVALPPAPQPIVEPAPAPAPPVEPPAESFPKKLAIGNSGWLQVGALMQGWFVMEDGTNIAKNPAGGSFDTTAYFRLRRAQVKLSGDIVKDKVGFFMLFDMAKTLKFKEISANGTTTGYSPPSDTSALLDFLVTYKTSIADVSIGQWKGPISYDSTTSSAELLLPERSFPTRYFGESYDAGIRAEKKFEYVKYSLQLLQGMPAPNQLDNNRQKEVALRLEFTPFKGFMVGGAGLTSVGQRESQASTRDVVEADVVVNMDDFVARGELLWGWAGVTADGAERVKSRGMSATVGYTIASKIQPVARVSYLDIDATTDGTPAGQPLTSKFGYNTDEIRAYELGVNYLIDGKFAKIQAAYGYLDMDNIPYRQQFILSGQVTF